MQCICNAIQMKTNLLLYSLIFLESGFIYYSYMDTLGLSGTLFPAIFYILIALVDIHSTSRKYAILVLITTIGIAVPRVLIKIEDLNERVFTKQVESIKSRNPEFNPILQDCNLLVQWDLEGRNSCMKSNKMQMEKANEHNFKVKSEANMELQSVRIGVREYAEILLFSIISVCLPLAIFILLYDSKKQLSTSTGSNGLYSDPWGQNAQQNNVHITNAIYPHPVFQENKTEESIQTVEIEPKKEIEEGNTILNYLKSNSIDYDRSFVLSGVTFDYFVKAYNLVIDVADNGSFPSLARACLAKKRLTHSLGYSYLILSPYCINSLKTYFASKIPRYTILLEDYRSSTFLHSISVQLNTKEISELTTIPTSSIYRKLSR